MASAKPKNNIVMIRKPDTNGDCINNGIRRWRGRNIIIEYLYEVTEVPIAGIKL
jgi:hypothetical protein